MKLALWECCCLFRNLKSSGSVKSTLRVLSTSSCQNQEPRTARKPISLPHTQPITVPQKVPTIISNLWLIVVPYTLLPAIPSQYNYLNKCTPSSRSQSPWQSPWVWNTEPQIQFKASTGTPKVTQPHAIVVPHKVPRHICKPYPLAIPKQVPLLFPVHCPYG